MTSDLQSILKRVEEATGPDRELDFAILKVLRLVPEEAVWVKTDAPFNPKRNWETPAYREHLEKFTKDVDEFPEDGHLQFLTWYAQRPAPSPYWDGTGIPPSGRLRTITTSLDAALSLAEEMLPGWVPGQLSWAPNRTVTMWFTEPGHESKPRGVIHNGSVCKTPPLAVLSAFLRALIAKRQTEEAR